MTTHTTTATALGNHAALNASPSKFKAAALQMGYGAGFANAMEEMMRCEGTGRAENIGDGAGITFCGLTTKHNLRGYSAADCNRMTIAQVLERYYNSYWQNIGLDKFNGIAPAVAFRCFDANVNSGGGGLKHMLSWVVSRLHIPSNGGNSADKMQAIAQAIKEGKISEDAVHKECANARTWWYRVRCSGSWPKFGRGWMNRLRHVAERVGLIRGQGPDTSFIASFDNDAMQAPNPFPITNPLGFVFSQFQGALKLLLGIPNNSDPSPGKSFAASAKEGDKLGREDSESFTKCFGEARESYNPNAAPKSPRQEHLDEQRKQGTPLAAEKPKGPEIPENSLESALLKTSQERQALLLAQKKEKEKSASPWWARRSV